MYDKIISNAWSFARQPKQILLSVFLDLVLFSAIIGAVIATDLNFSIVNIFLIWTTTIIFLVLLGIFEYAFFTHNFTIFTKRKNLILSAYAVKNAYPRLLAASILVGIIGVISSLLFIFLFFVGWIFQIIVAAAFMFVTHGIILGKNNTLEAISNSINIFKKSFVDVLITWLLTVAFFFIILAITISPLIFYVLYGFFNIAQSGFLGTDMFILLSLSTIAFIGLSIARLMLIGIITGSYLKLKKK